MRVLLVHHGSLHSAAPTTGGAIRAADHRAGLQAAGHEVVAVARAQDEAGGFSGPAHLRALARRAAVDWILCLTPEDAPALAGVAPLVVDLYAPRLLEAAWEGQQEDEARRALLAVDAADEVIFSNPRQRWFWLGILGLAGWDLQKSVGAVVPLVAHTAPSPKRQPRAGALPVVIAGGHPWPWQDAREALARAARHLGKRARVVSYGLPAVEGVEAHGLVSIEEWRTACAGATVALDRYAPHVERELALSFRQMDYLAAGLPLVSDPWTPLADGIREAGAGVVDLELEAALDAALGEGAALARGARALAGRYSASVAGSMVGSLRPKERQRDWSAVRWSRKAAAAELRAVADRELRREAEAEVVRKRAEVEALVGQSRALTASVEHLSAAMADVAGFRRETVQVLGTRLAGQSEEAEHLRRELAIARADVEKKQLELGQLREERDRLGGVIARITRR